MNLQVKDLTLGQIKLWDPALQKLMEFRTDGDNLPKTELEINEDCQESTRSSCQFAVLFQPDV